MINARSLLRKTIAFNDGFPWMKIFSSNISVSTSRCYAFKSDLKIKWIRPEKIPSTDPIKSGDFLNLPPISDKTVLKDYEKSNELKT